MHKQPLPSSSPLSHSQSGHSTSTPPASDQTDLQRSFSAPCYDTVQQLHRQFEKALSSLLSVLETETTLLTQAQSNINTPLLQLIDQKQPHLSQLHSLQLQIAEWVRQTQPQSAPPIKWETILDQHFNTTIEHWKVIKDLQHKVQAQNQTNARLLQYREQRAGRLHQALKGAPENTASSYNQQGYGVVKQNASPQNRIKA